MVHHSLHVSHPLFESRQLVYGNPVRESRATLIKQDQARESRQAAEKTSERCFRPDVLQMRQATNAKKEVAWALTHHLVRDVNVPVAGITGCRDFLRWARDGLFGVRYETVAPSMRRLDEPRLAAGIAECLAEFRNLDL